MKISENSMQLFYETKDHKYLKEMSNILEKKLFEKYKPNYQVEEGVIKSSVDMETEYFQKNRTDLLYRAFNVVISTLDKKIETLNKERADNLLIKRIEVSSDVINEFRKNYIEDKPNGIEERVVFYVNLYY